MARVLLSDDDVAYAELLQAALAGHPLISLTHVAPLEKAVERLEDEHFDAVLFDTTTVDVARLRSVFEQQSSRPPAPLIALVSVADDERIAEVLQGGAHDCLLKTETDAALVSRVIKYGIELSRIQRQWQVAQQFRRLVENAHSIIAILEGSGVIVYLSPGIERSLGSPAADLVGNVIWELVHPDAVEDVQAMLRDLFARGEVGSIEFQMRHVDGSWRTLEAAAQLLDDQQPPQAALSCRDVTEQRRAEAASRDRDEQLRQAQKMEVIGRLASGIAHDFSNLLTIMIDASGQLLAGLPPEAPLRAHAESINQSAERAASMTRQLLGFSRLPVLGPTLLDLNHVLDEATQLLRRLIGEQLELRTIHGPDLWPVRANRTHIDQVLLNLAVNARDAMPSGGCLTIETKNVPGRTLSTDNGQIPGPHVVVTVSDTGSGMDDMTRARAFEPFFTTKERGKGTGLGLATVRRIVELNDGWTTLASTPGVGTTVTFGLPRAQGVGEAAEARPTPLPPVPAAAPSCTGDETVLLVEDEAGVRELVRDILELAGYRVLEADLPSAAVRLSGEFEGPIHLLLTDVVMPEMSGLELVARVQATGRSPQVMYMSGYSEPTTGDGGGSAPGAYFLPKPFKRQLLLRRVREALDGVESTGH